MSGYAGPREPAHRPHARRGGFPGGRRRVVPPAADARGLLEVVAARGLHHLPRHGGPRRRGAHRGGALGSASGRGRRGRTGAGGRGAGSGVGPRGAAPGSLLGGRGAPSLTAGRRAHEVAGEVGGRNHRRDAARGHPRRAAGVRRAEHRRPAREPGERAGDLVGRPDAVAGADEHVDRLGRRPELGGAGAGARRVALPLDTARMSRRRQRRRDERERPRAGADEPSCHRAPSQLAPIRRHKEGVSPAVSPPTGAAWPSAGTPSTGAAASEPPPPCAASAGCEAPSAASAARRSSSSSEGSTK